MSELYNQLASEFEPNSGSFIKSNGDEFFSLIYFNALKRCIPSITSKFCFLLLKLKGVYFVVKFAVIKIIT